MGIVVQVFSNTSTTGSVQTNGVNLCGHQSSSDKIGIKIYLVQEGKSAILFCQITNFLDRADTTAHGVDTFESDDLGYLLGVLFEFCFQILEVVMFEENPFSTRMAHSLYHGSVIHGVREKDTAWKLGTESRESSVVGNVAGRKDEGCGFSMKVCEFLFQRKMHSTVAGYVTSAASTMTVFIESAAWQN